MKYCIFWNQTCRWCRERTVHKRTTHPGGPLYVKCVGCGKVWKFEGKERHCFIRSHYDQELLVARLTFEKRWAAMARRCGP